MIWNSQKNLIMQFLKASFKIRLLAGLIDILIFLLFSFLTSYLIFLNSNFMNSSGKKDLESLRYYLWFFVQITLIFCLQIIIPSFLLQGQTIGRWLVRIKLIPEFEKDISKIKMFIYVLKKELFHSIAWIIVFLIFAILISPRLATKMIGVNFGVKIKNNFLNNVDDDPWENFEKALISIPIFIVNLNILINVTILISIAKFKQGGFTDLYSRTLMVYKYKFNENQNLFQLKPEDVEWETIKWN